MQTGCSSSNKTQEIAEIFISGCNKPDYYSKTILYNYLKKNPKSIKINISPYPYLLPAVSSKNQRYVHSEANDTPYDNLLKLPRT